MTDFIDCVWFRISLVSLRELHHSQHRSDVSQDPNLALMWIQDQTPKCLAKGSDSVVNYRCLDEHGSDSLGRMVAVDCKFAIKQE